MKQDRIEFVPHVSPTVPLFWDHSEPLLPLKEIFPSGQNVTVNHHVDSTSGTKRARLKPL